MFARGVTPIGPLHRGPGEINYPVSMGGIVVHPGDIIVGDLNGVVVVPRAIATELVDRLETRETAEANYNAAVARGEFSNDWVDHILTSNGVCVEDLCTNREGRMTSPRRAGPRGSARAVGEERRRP